MQRNGTMYFNACFISVVKVQTNEQISKNIFLPTIINVFYNVWVRLPIHYLHPPLFPFANTEKVAHPWMFYYASTVILLRIHGYFIAHPRLREFFALFRTRKTRSARYNSAFIIAFSANFVSKFRIKLYFNLASQEEFRRHLRKMQENLLFHSVCTNFADIRGEKSSGQECVSCFILYDKIANFIRRGEDEDTLILFCICTRTASRCALQSIQAA